MPRPRQFRKVGFIPASTYYKPRGIPLSILECVNLTLDEMEAIRLADLEGQYQEYAAEKMNISRQTFGRILDSAHLKISDALVNGKALSIEGGPVEQTFQRKTSTDSHPTHCPGRRKRRRRHQ